jgi:hypothetical protein
VEALAREEVQHPGHRPGEKQPTLDDDEADAVLWPDGFGMVIILGPADRDVAAAEGPPAVMQASGEDEGRLAAFMGMGKDARTRPRADETDILARAAGKRAVGEAGQEVPPADRCRRPTEGGAQRPGKDRVVLDGRDGPFALPETGEGGAEIGGDDGAGHGCAEEGAADRLEPRHPVAAARTEGEVARDEKTETIRYRPRGIGGEMGVGRMRHRAINVL